MKTTFVAIFDPIWTNTLTQKGPNKSFNNILVKKDRKYIINFVTNLSEILESNHFFTIFEPNQAKIWP